MKKFLKGLLVFLMFFVLVGCNKALEKDDDYIESEDEYYDFAYKDGFPASSLVKDVPKPDFGSIVYDEDEEGIYIYVSDVTEENVKNYIASLPGHGWNVDPDEENSDTYFSAYNAEGQYIDVSYYEGEMSIIVYSA